MRRWHWWLAARMLRLADFIGMTRAERRAQRERARAWSRMDQPG
jgi:hypothetical protein